MSNLQQINLLLPEFQPDRQSFRFMTMLSAWCVIIFLFAMLQTWGWYQLQHTREQLADIEVEQVKMLQQLETLRDTTPRNTRIRMQNNFAAVLAEIAQQRRLLEIIKGRDIGNSDGFSGFMIGFSRQHIQGLSLEAIDLTQGGDLVQLSGWTYKPELVPDYIQRLRREESFQTTHFGDMSIERIPGERSDALRFVLGKSQEGGS